MLSGISKYQSSNLYYWVMRIVIQRALAIRVKLLFFSRSPNEKTRRSGFFIYVQVNLAWRHSNFQSMTGSLLRDIHQHLGAIHPQHTD